MNILEKFSNLKISAEEQEMVNGGYKVAGSGTAPNGSKYSYDGDLSGTSTGSIGGSSNGVSGSITSYVRDFTGKATLDGGYKIDYFTDVP